MRESKYTRLISKEDILKVVDSNLTPKEIEVELKIPRRRVYDLLSFYGIQVKNKGISIKKNDTFFDLIDSEIKAYLLGFLIADGCVLVEPKKRDGKVYSWNKRISFCNSIDDLSVIELIRDNICPDNTITFINNQKGVKTIRKLQCRLRWSSSHMVNRLIEYGIKPRKTHDVNFEFDFSILPNDKLTIHFLRGFFDGDGCVTLTKHYKYVKVGFVSTSLTFLNQIVNFYVRFGFHFKVSNHKSKNMSYYSIWIKGGTNKTNEFERLMYDNANFYLQRKLNKFIQGNTEVSKQIAQGCLPL